VRPLATAGALVLVVATQASPARAQVAVYADRVHTVSGAAIANGVVLVGKDGTVAHRSGEPVEPEYLYALIDEMPIRRREMRERGG